MVSKKTPPPTEHIECVQFANWLRFKGYLFSHIANETSIKNWAFLRKRKAAGLNAGVPDYIILVPRENKHDVLVFIEMKRKSNSHISDEQRMWVSNLNRIPSVEAYIAKGADDAINFITQISCPTSNTKTGSPTHTPNA